MLDSEQTTDLLGAHVMITPQELGAQGEAFVLARLKSAGLAVEQAGPGDILVTSSSLAIEVKSARLTKRVGRPSRRYQFNLRKKGHTDHRHTDLVILLCYSDVVREPSIYAIPTMRLNGNRVVKLPERLNAYDGKWSCYAGFDRALEMDGVEL